jgi:hypothetical protein
MWGSRCKVQGARNKENAMRDHRKLRAFELADAFQLSLASRLGLMNAAEARPVAAAADEVCRVVGSLARAVRTSLRANGGAGFRAKRQG